MYNTAAFVLARIERTASESLLLCVFVLSPLLVVVCGVSLYRIRSLRSSGASTRTVPSHNTTLLVLGLADRPEALLGLFRSLQT